MRQVVVIIGGNSSKNLQWVKDMTEAYQEDYDVIPLFFDHWGSDSTGVDFESELTKLAAKLSAHREYNIVAKSAGVLLALLGIKRGILKPKAFVALGTPLRYAEDRNIDIRRLYLGTSGGHRLLAIQQINDPVGSANQVKEVLTPQVRFIEIEGDDHSYGTIADIKKYTDDFIAGN